MNDDTDGTWGEPAKPAEPAEPAKPADAPECEIEDAPASASPEPPQAPEPAPAPAFASEPPAAPTPSASPYGAPQQPTMPYGAPQQQAPSYGAPVPPQPQSPYGGYAQQPYAPMPAPGAPGSGKALASLVCGICAIVFSGTVVIGIVLGIVALVLASQYVKSFGKDGKATGGKVCGIIGIVLSVLALAGYLMLGALTFAALEEYANDPTYGYSGSSEILPAPESSSAAADDAAVKAAAEQTLGSFANPDQALLARVAEKADDAFRDSTDLALSDVGVDSVEFAQWLMGGVTYTMTDDDAYAYSDGTGTAFAETQSRSLYVLNEVLYDDVTAYVEQSGGFADEAEYQAKLAELLPAAMEKVAGTTEESFLMLDFTKTGDAWTVDDDSFEEALEQMFGLW